MKKKAVYQDVFPDSLYPVKLTQTNNSLFHDIIYCHWHDAIEFIYVTEGCLALKIDMEDLIIHTGELAMVNSGQVHFGNSVDSSFCNAYAFVFKLEMLSFADDDYNQKKYIEPIHKGTLKFPSLVTGQTPWGREIIATIVRIIERKDQNLRGDELLLKADIYSILARLFSADAFVPAEDFYITSPKVERLRTLMEYIHNHYSEKIYIEALAKEVHMSEDNLYKYFKGLTGRTPTEYINLYRIHMAEQLLAKDADSISDVCFQVGFENISYFIKTFKKYRSCTPKQYQKLQ